MLSRIRKLAEFEILIAVASAVFGLLISPLLEKITSPLFDTPTRAVLVGIIILAVLAVIVVLTIGIFARRNEQIINKVNGELFSINQRLGLTVRFLHDPPKRSNGEVYRTAREIIEGAEKEILVLYYSRRRERPEWDRGHEVETEEYRIERERYSQALVEKVKQHRADKYFYKRLMQFPEGTSAEITEERIGKRWYDHLKAILEIQEDYPEAAYIKVAPLFLEQTVVIVDSRYVFWGIDSLDPEHSVRYMEGSLIFDDPHQEFVGYFKAFFQRVDAHAIILRKLPGTKENRGAQKAAG